MSFYKEVPGRKTTLESTLKFDIEPKAGSTNPVTSCGVASAITEAVGTASDALQEQIDEIAEKAGSGYTPKGPASVATLNGLTGQENGWLYTLTDDGTLTDGSLAVVAGDTVAWDATNEVWYKAMDYAPRQYGTNEVHNLTTSITAFRTGDVIPVDGPSGTAKMSKDDLLRETAENATIKETTTLTNIRIERNCIVNPLGHEDHTLVEPYGCTDYVLIELIKGMTAYKLCSMPDSNINACIFFDENKNFIGVYSNGRNYNLSVKIDDTLLASFPNAYYVRFNVYKTTPTIYFSGSVQHLAEEIAEQSNVALNNLLNFTNIPIERNCIVNSLGNEDHTLAEPYGCTGFIDLEIVKGMTICDITSRPNTNVNACIFFDENKTFIGVYSDGTKNKLNVTLDDTLLANYPDARYVRVNVDKNTSRIYFNTDLLGMADGITERINAHERVLAYTELCTNNGFLNKNGTTSVGDGTYKYSEWLRISDFYGCCLAPIFGHKGYNIVPVQLANANKQFTRSIEAEVNNDTCLWTIGDGAQSGDVYFRVCARNTWKVRVTNSLDSELVGLQLSLPKNIYVAIGEKLQIFKNSLYYGMNRTERTLYRFTGDSSNEMSYWGDFIEWTPNSAKTILLKPSVLRHDLSSFAIAKTYTSVKSFAKKSSPATAKNLLILGDSFTANNYYPQELKRRLIGSGTAAYVDPNGPASDNLSNLNVFIEGHVGWDYDNYLGSSSPFYNPNTQQIDIDYYCTQKGITGGVDYVAIVLGTNHQCADSVISEFWEKLKAHNANIKVVVSGRILYSPYKVHVSTSIFEYNRRVEALADSASYSSNFCFADILPTFDMDNNMSMTEVDANTRNPTRKRIVSTDYTHPSKYGYWQIADTIYSAIHYWCL